MLTQKNKNIVYVHSIVLFQKYICAIYNKYINRSFLNEYIIFITTPYNYKCIYHHIIEKFIFIDIFVIINIMTIS